MTQSSHHVEPIRPGGGLRRLRKGDLGRIADTAAQKVLSSAQFMSVLEAEAERARRDEGTVLVMRVRIRPFPRPVGGAVGNHAVPDELLDRIVATDERAKTAVMSPSELLIMVPGLERRSGGEELASRLLDVLAQPVVVDRLPFRAAPRAGSVLLDSENPSGTQLVQGAGLALDEADSTRRHVLFHPYHRVRAERNAEIETALRDAVLDGEIGCALQPAFDLATGRVVAFEALARWNRLEKGSVPPIDFVPMAEAIGVSPVLGRQVLARALSTVSGLVGAGVIGDVTLWVNVSPSEMLDPELVPTMSTAIEVDPRVKIGLELSPSPPADAKEPYEVLKVLTGRGVRAAVADFGVGNANLTVLQQLPFDSVKLNRELTKQIAGNEQAADLLATLVRLADLLGLETTAQGIESEEQARLVTGLGCRIGQGYFYAQPDEDPDALRSRLSDAAPPA
jgi:EAL domain-containing protein (putative c-di-GMP-specific phosphodiesterase class I)